MLITLAQTAYHNLRNKFRTHILAARFWFDLAPEVYIQRNYTKAFFLYWYLLRKIFSSVAVALAVNFTAKFWRQALLAQF